MIKAATLTLMACGGVVLAGCGQKGALYLPDKNAAVVTRPAGPQSGNSAPAQPAPAPAQQPQNKNKTDDDSASSKPKS